MKRILAAVLAAVFCISLSGCTLLDGMQYMKAMELYEEGAYAEAMEIFTELTDYADSEAMAHLCRQKVDYAQAEALFTAEEYAQALELYTDLALYEDSPIKAVQCRYAIAKTHMTEGNYAEACRWFRELGSYEDAPELTEQARWLWLWAYLAENGPVQQSLDPEGTRVLSLSAAGENRLQLSYTAEGSLLGIPYSDSLRITFGRYGADAVYEARCASQAASTITEEACGTLYTDSFLPGAPVALESFRQTITVAYADGTEPPEPVVTEDTEQMLLLKAMFISAQTAVQEQLAQLLAATGVEITARDLGFVLSE